MTLVKGNTINFEIEGGKKLSGTVVTKTSKNGAMGIIPAALLNKGKTILKNVPKIEEVYRMVEVMESIGVSIKWNGNDLEIEAKKVNLKNINRESAERTRSII